jgi:serine/threonine protein kinase
MHHDLSGLSGQKGQCFVAGQVRCYVLQMLEGLYMCHKKGILHRDIKGVKVMMRFLSLGTDPSRSQYVG